MLALRQRKTYKRFMTALEDAKRLRESKQLSTIKRMPYLATKWRFFSFAFVGYLCKDNLYNLHLSLFRKQSFQQLRSVLVGLLIMHYNAFAIVSFTWLAYFLSHDYLSYISWQHSIVHGWRHNIVHSWLHNIVHGWQHNIVHGWQMKMESFNVSKKYF